MITPFDPPPSDCQWRVAPHNLNYEVSEFGHLRRCKPGGSRTWVGKLVRPSKSSEGYAQYKLSLEGVIRCTKAHRLVGQAFIPNPLGLPLVAHIDGTKTNCAIINLRWSSAAENSADMVRHGTSRKGEKANTAKLTAAQILEIRRAPGLQREIAEQFGIDQTHVSRIKRGVNWRHV